MRALVSLIAITFMFGAIGQNFKKYNLKKYKKSFKSPKRKTSGSLKNSAGKSVKVAPRFKFKRKKCPKSYVSGVRGVVSNMSGMKLKKDGCYKLGHKKSTTHRGKKVCWRGPKKGDTQVQLYYGSKKASCYDPGFTLCANDGLDKTIWPDDRIKSASTVLWKLKSSYKWNGVTHCKYKMANGTNSLMTWTLK